MNVSDQLHSLIDLSPSPHPLSRTLNGS